MASCSVNETGVTLTMNQDEAGALLDVLGNKVSVSDVAHRLLGVAEGSVMRVLDKVFEGKRNCFTLEGYKVKEL